jgi:hypothetical protein
LYYFKIKLIMHSNFFLNNQLSRIIEFILKKNRSLITVGVPRFWPWVDDCDGNGCLLSMERTLGMMGNCFESIGYCGPIFFYVLNFFLKKIKIFLFFLFQINIFLVFLDYFDVLISKIIFLKIKNIILILF